MILTYNNQWLIYDAQVFDNFAEPVRYVYTGPNVSAAPTSGIYDTSINLSHSTPQGYDFVEYSATGANIDGNTFKIGDTDVYVEGVFTDHYYTINTSSSHGTITANHNTAKHGTTITLSNSPAAGYDFDYYEVVGATLINDNQFVIGYSDVTVVGHFKSTTKHATVHLRLPDVADTFTESGTTWYPYAIDTLWRVVSYTGDNIDSITRNAYTCRCYCMDGPLHGSNTKTIDASTGTVLDRTNTNVQMTVHATGSESDWAYEVRARSNARSEVIAVKEYNGQTQQYELHQVNPRNTQDAAGCWNYGRGQGVVAYTGTIANWPQRQLSVDYNIDGSIYCMPNPYKSYKDVIVDLTWTE